MGSAWADLKARQKRERVDFVVRAIKSSRTISEAAERVGMDRRLFYRLLLEVDAVIRDDRATIPDNRSAADPVPDLDAAICDHLDREAVYSMAEMRAAPNHAEMRQFDPPGRPEWWSYMGATNQELADAAMARGIWAPSDHETSATEGEQP